MLDKNAIAAASKIAARPLARRHQIRRPRRRTAAARPHRGLRDPGGNRKIFVRSTVRLEDRGHQRGRTKAHQCRRPDGRTHPGRDRDRRWRHGFDGGQRNARRRAGIRLSHARRSAGARRRPTRCSRCSTRSTRCIPRSRFRIRGLPISSAPAPRRSLPTMPARICSCWDRRQRADWRSLRSRRGAARHHAARPAIHRSRQERAGRSPRGADLARQRTAPAWRDAEGRPRSSPPAPAIRRCRFSPAIFAPWISARSERCRWGSSRLSPRHCERSEAIHRSADGERIARRLRCSQ